MVNAAPDSLTTKILVDAAVRGLRETGLKPEKLRGRAGRGWTIEENGSRKSLTIRTTRDRYIAFNPLPNYSGWKTLDDVDVVIVAAVDHPDSPTAILIYRFDAAEVRRRFDESRDATLRKGNKVSLDAGWWVGLDRTRRNRAGEGIATEHEPIARILIEDPPPSIVPPTQPAPDPPKPEQARHQDTVDKIMTDTRRRLAGLLGVHADRIKVDFKIEDR